MWLPQSQLGGSLYGGAPGVHVELGEDVLGMAAERVDGHEELLSDLGPGQGGGQQPEHLQLPVAQPLVLQCGLAGTWAGLDPVLREAHEAGRLLGARSTASGGGLPEEV